jgi:multidrug efflux pump subunit AcrA (membrane-fusion protein)
LDLVAKQKAQQALASYQSAKNQLASAQSTQYSLQSKLFATNQKFINGAVAQGLANTDPNYIQQDADWLASEATYKDQAAVISQAQTSVSQAWLNYQQTSDTVYAPISGKITGLSLQPGSVITSSENSTKLANVITSAVPTVKANITEIDVGKLKVGQKATVTFDALPDQTFVGSVTSIDTVGQVSSGVTSYPITVSLSDANPNILPNMAATANIQLESKNDVVFVPNAAVLRQGQSPMVRVMKSGKPQVVTVETGMTTDTQTEIISGLLEGEVVITGTTTPSTRTSTTGTSPFSALGGNRGFAAGGAARSGNVIRVSGP